MIIEWRMLIEAVGGGSSGSGEQCFVGGIGRRVLRGGQVVEVHAESGVQAMGERIDGVGDQAGVVAGRDRLVVVCGVGELLGGDVEQVARCPLARVRGADRGDQAGPGGIGGDGLGERGPEHDVEVAHPGRA